MSAALKGSQSSNREQIAVPGYPTERIAHPDHITYIITASGGKHARLVDIYSNRVEIHVFERDERVAVVYPQRSLVVDALNRSDRIDGLNGLMTLVRGELKDGHDAERSFVDAIIAVTMPLQITKEEMIIARHLDTEVRLTYWGEIYLRVGADYLYYDDRHGRVRFVNEHASFGTLHPDALRSVLDSEHLGEVCTKVIDGALVPPLKSRSERLSRIFKLDNLDTAYVSATGEAKVMPDKLRMQFHEESQKVTGAMASLEAMSCVIAISPDPVPDRGTQERDETTSVSELWLLLGSTHDGAPRPLGRSIAGLSGILKQVSRRAGLKQSENEVPGPEAKGA